jgi:hypothetical protein
MDAKKARHRRECGEPGSRRTRVEEPGPTRQGAAQSALRAAIALVLLGGNALARDKMGESSPWVQCDHVQLLEAFGFPAPKRSYKIRGICRVEKHIYDTDPTHELDTQIVAFEVLGSVTYDGVTKKTGESLKINGANAATSMECIADPFVREPGKSYHYDDYGWSGCTNTQAAGISNMWLATALLGQPMFRLTVDPAMAEALSKLAPTKPTGAPAPPPATKTPKVLKKGGPEAVGPSVPVFPQPPSGTSRQAPAGGGPSMLAPHGLVISPTPPPVRAAFARRPPASPTPTPTPKVRRKK